MLFFILSKTAFSLWATGIWYTGRIILMFYYFWFLYYFLLEAQGSIIGWFSHTPSKLNLLFSLTSPSFRILSPGTRGWHWCLGLILVLILLVLVWKSTLTVGTSVIMITGFLADNSFLSFLPQTVWLYKYSCIRTFEAFCSQVPHHNICKISWLSQVKVKKGYCFI